MNACTIYITLYRKGTKNYNGSTVWYKTSETISYIIELGEKCSTKIFGVLCFCIEQGYAL